MKFCCTSADEITFRELTVHKSSKIQTLKFNKIKTFNQIRITQKRVALKIYFFKLSISLIKLRLNIFDFF